jgi:ribonuclease I
MQDRNLKSCLLTQWPNLLGSNDVFSKIEWDKHEKCSEVKFNQTQYFNLALNIKAQVNILNALLKEGFKPNNSATYNINEVADAIKEGIPNKSYPELHCANFNSIMTSYLAEVRLCLDFDGINFMSCNPRTSGYGKNFVILPL